MTAHKVHLHGGTHPNNRYVKVAARGVILPEKVTADWQLVTCENCRKRMGEQA